jgi:protein-L-isoaspartate(D-aspartate) O-methyltransferase
MPALRRDWTGQVDRRLFIPETIWTQEEEGGWYVPVHQTRDPAAWEALVAADEPVITQVECFVSPEGDSRPGHASSSSSAPWIMNRMLDALDLEPGMRVLEIGAGTGWNAALIAAAGAHVTTVEVDPALAAHARAALARAGYPSVIVLTGDGEHGAPDHAPFDRVIASAAAHTVPYPWVSQTRDGGLIVFPYTGQHHRAGLAVLTVSGDRASGQITGEAGYMPLRGQALHPMQFQQLRIPPSGVIIRIDVGPDGQHITIQP